LTHEFSSFCILIFNPQHEFTQVKLNPDTGFPSMDLCVGDTKSSALAHGRSSLDQQLHGEFNLYRKIASSQIQVVLQYALPTPN